MNELLSPGPFYSSLSPNNLLSSSSNAFEKNIGALISNFKNNFQDELTFSNMSSDFRTPLMTQEFQEISNKQLDNTYNGENMFLDLLSNDIQDFRNPEVDFILDSFLHELNIPAPMQAPPPPHKRPYGFPNNIKHKKTKQMAPFTNYVNPQGFNSAYMSRRHNEFPQHPQQAPQMQSNNRITAKIAPLKSFQCIYCSSVFGRLHDLKRHMYTHNNNKPFKCQFCTKAFSRRDALKRHEKCIFDGTKKTCQERTGEQSNINTGTVKPIESVMQQSTREYYNYGISGNNSYGVMNPGPNQM